MLVKSALLNLEVQQLFAPLPSSCPPFRLPLTCSHSFTHSLCHTHLLMSFLLRAHVPVDFKSFRCFPVACHHFLVFLPSNALNRELETLSCIHSVFLHPRILLVFYQFYKTSDFLKHAFFGVSSLSRPPNFSSFRI